MNTPNDNMPPAPATSTPPPPPMDDGSTPQVVSVEERQWAMFAHLSALLGGLCSWWVGGWGVFIGPLIIWLVKKDTMPFVDDQGKEALNFNISVAIAFVALWILVFMTLGIGIVIAIPGWFIIGIYWLVFTIIAAIKSNEGVRYRYPLTLRLIK